MLATEAVSHANGTSVDYAGIKRGRRITARTWDFNATTHENVFDLGRELTHDADDGKTLNLDTSYIASGIRHYDHWDIPVEQYLRMRDFAPEGTLLNETAGHVVTRSGSTNLLSASLMEFIYAHHTLTAQNEIDGLGMEGDSALLLAIRGGSGIAALNSFQADIYLTPTDGAGGGGQGEQRVESVTFADEDNITTTQRSLTLSGTTPIAVEFGEGDCRNADRYNRRNHLHHCGGGRLPVRVRRDLPGGRRPNDAVHGDSAGQRRRGNRPQYEHLPAQRRHGRRHPHNRR